MKLAVLAIPLLLSGAVAIAQSATDTDITPAPGTTALVPTPDASAPGGMSTTVVTTPASGRTIQPSNARPRLDDRGVAVISDPAVVPDGFNGVTGSQAMGGPIEDTANVQTVPTTSADVPVCSRSVTDHCVESYRQDYTGH